jgi:membrane-associated protease RseP (regulator of RpoE activity)
VTTEAAAPPDRWQTHLWLFLGTVVSAFVTYYFWDAGATTRERLTHGAEFAGTLLTILVAHELGHYVAARIHKVDASLPFFIPLPILSPFGTMGAVIRMRGVIPTRRALLDIGASGPLAGLVFAIPLYAWGAAHSTLVPMTGGAGMELGESILMKVLDALFAAPQPPGYELSLSPIAFGAWGGLFVTMINLIPVSQLDGGHVAYALFGPRQDRFAVTVHRAMLVFFFVVLAGHTARDVAGGLGLWHMGQHLANAVVWIVWFQLLAILGLVASRGRADYDEKPGTLTIRARLLGTLVLFVLASLARSETSRAGRIFLPLAFFAALGMFLAMERRGGVLKKHDLLDHPPTSAPPLDPLRAGVAILTLVMFVLLFMPEPFSM